jgi:hypothetical protein
MDTIREVDTTFDALDREINKPIIYEEKYKAIPFIKPVNGFRKVKVGVNDLCPCSSGIKFKKCCKIKSIAFNCLSTNCKFCNCTVKSINKEDYLNHVMTDREELIIQLNEYGASRESLVFYEKDKNKLDKLKAETQLEINRYIIKIQIVDEYLKKETVGFLHDDI